MCIGLLVRNICESNGANWNPILFPAAITKWIWSIFTYLSDSYNTYQLAFAA